jgi:hypothetical protein
MSFSDDHDTEIEDLTDLTSLSPSSSIERPPNPAPLSPPAPILADDAAPSAPVSLTQAASFQPDLVRPALNFADSPASSGFSST